MQKTIASLGPQNEINEGKRFAFGANWKRFLTTVNDERIDRAVRSLQTMLELDTLDGKRFIDIGSGSGLFSLAARKLGATVHSFDYDIQSVACTNELRRMYFRDDPHWIVEQGSVLDTQYLNKLGKFDIVYSWGVLHHTGAMWQALNNVADCVGAYGKLFIALYNDQGRASKYWLSTKKLYNALPAFLRPLIVIPCLVRLWGPTTIRDLALGRPFRTWGEYSKYRGMSPIRDVVDWVGGYPFEVSKPEEIFSYYRKKGFTLVVLQTCAGGHGCNEFVFQKNS